MARAAIRSMECGTCSEESLATWRGGACGGQGEAQGDMGACQCHHILPLSCIIAVITSSLRWWGHGGLLREKVDIDGDGGVMYGHWGNFDLSKGTKGKVWQSYN